MIIVFFAIFFLAELIVLENQIEMCERIGKGTFGTVFKGIYLGTEVAIKSLDVFSEEVKAKALKEVEILLFTCLLIPIINVHFQDTKAPKRCNTHGGLH